MIVGLDFPSLFTGDNFNQRRAACVGAGVAYDPESLISGAELAKGLSYDNSSRNWISEEHYHNAVAGKLTTEEILEGAPRVLKTSVEYGTGDTDDDSLDGADPREEGEN